MLIDAFTALEQTRFAAGLRGSVWLYPLVNAAHILGVGLLFGAIAAFDLRILGFGRGIGVEAAGRLLLPVAVGGFVLAVTAGAMLFTTDAGDYAASTFFRAKLALIALGLANAAAMRAALRRRQHGAGSGRRLAAGAAISLCTWAGVIVLGRLMGYF